MSSSGKSLDGEEEQEKVKPDIYDIFHAILAFANDAASKQLAQLLHRKVNDSEDNPMRNIQQGYAEDLSARISGVNNHAARLKDHMPSDKLRLEMVVAFMSSIFSFTVVNKVTQQAKPSLFQFQGPKSKMAPQLTPLHAVINSDESFSNLASFLLHDSMDAKDTVVVSGAKGARSGYFMEQYFISEEEAQLHSWQNSQNACQFDDHPISTFHDLLVSCADAIAVCARDAICGQAVDANLFSGLTGFAFSCSLAVGKFLVRSLLSSNTGIMGSLQHVFRKAVAFTQDCFAGLFFG